VHLWDKRGHIPRVVPRWVLASSTLELPSIELPDMHNVLSYAAAYPALVYRAHSGRLPHPTRANRRGLRRTKFLLVPSGIGAIPSQ
jgi:hypothetical protein